MASHKNYCSEFGIENRSAASSALVAPVVAPRGASRGASSHVPNVARHSVIPTSIVLMAALLSGCSASYPTNPSASENSNDNLVRSQVEANKQTQSSKRDLQRVKTTANTDMKKDQDGAELVGDLNFSNGTISANVMSNGCTTSEDFIVEHEVVNGTCLAQIVRVKPDFCRRVPFVASIEFSWSQPQECTGLPVEFINPPLDASAGTPVSKTLIKRDQ